MVFLVVCLKYFFPYCPQACYCLVWETGTLLWIPIMQILPAVRECWMLAIVHSCQSSSSSPLHSMAFMMSQQKNWSTAWGGKEKVHLKYLVLTSNLQEPQTTGNKPNLPKHMKIYSISLTITRNTSFSRMIEFPGPNFGQQDSSSLFFFKSARLNCNRSQVQ